MEARMLKPLMANIGDLGDYINCKIGQTPQLFHSANLIGENRRTRSTKQRPRSFWTFAWAQKKVSKILLQTYGTVTHITLSCALREIGIKRVQKILKKRAGRKDQKESGTGTEVLA